MTTYSEAFIKKYKDEVPFISRADLLDAFWYYCNRHQKLDYLKKCDKIMKEFKSLE